MRGQRAGWRNPVSAADGLGLGWVGCQMFVAARGIWRGRSSQPAAGCEKKNYKSLAQRRQFSSWQHVPVLSPVLASALFLPSFSLDPRPGHQISSGFSSRRSFPLSLHSCSKSVKGFGIVLTCPFKTNNLRHIEGMEATLIKAISNHCLRCSSSCCISPSGGSLQSSQRRILHNPDCLFRLKLRNQPTRV